MKVAIIGHLGIVGQAQTRMLAGHDLVTYDIDEDAPYPAEVASCDFAVVCVGTPALPDGCADLGYLRHAMRQLPDSVPVLIRSTVPPGTIDTVGIVHPGKVIAHAPEFICERDGGVWSESADVPWMILGGCVAATEFFRPRLAEVFPGHIHECSALHAELAKYTANLYWATRVTFVNEMSQVCKAFGTSWEPVREAWLCDRRVVPDYTAMAGFPPGFGGHCWPKDLSALIEASRDAGHYPWFLAAIEQANQRFQA
jgi:UDPglucose 6-dehydrogenase